MTSRESYHHGDLRTVLVAEGLRHLEAAGEDALSLRALAKEAGVSPNAPYRHFTDKNALMAALAAEGFQIFAADIEAAGQGLADPVEVLRSQSRAYLAFATTHPALYRLMFSPYGYSLHSEPCQVASARSFTALVQAAAAAQAVGWKADHELTALVMALWSALHGWARIQGDTLVPAGVPLPSTESWLRVFFDSKFPRIRTESRNIC